MGIKAFCGTAFEDMYNSMFAETKIVVTKIKVKCPDCGKEFEAEVPVKQKGTKLDFNVSPWPK